ncbi:MAG TPA: hypothetical protein VF753_18210 [Terriglobales bacterium]
MRKLIVTVLFTLLACNLFAGTKDKGTTTLKDVQPAGAPSKDYKQQYDLSFISAAGKHYTCRTGEKTKVDATDLPVGSSVTYEVDGNKGKVKTAAGKKFDCTIVRVADAPAAPPAPAK